MKKIIILTLALLLLAGNALPAQGDATPPLSSGIVNKSTQIYWGKGVQFPVLATVYIGTRLDVYEYDEDWVLVLHKTYGSYLGEFKEMSFYGYMSRDAIDCDPPLEGRKSAKADTGPGKKKGKKPKPRPSPKPGEPTPGSTQAPEEKPQPEPTVEQMDEFDWIIRTNGLKTQKVKVTGLTVLCSFSLMAQKVGGTAPSSDPTFNHGMRVPYAATAFFLMKLDMGNALGEMALSGFASGEGGFDLSLEAKGATFYLDTGAQNFSLVQFNLPMQATGTLDPMIIGESGSGTITSKPKSSSNSGDSSIPVQLKKSGGGYKLVLVGLKPDGGNLEFPAVLEKVFTDPDRFDKEAAKADARRKKAEAERDKMLKEQKRRAEEAAKAAADSLEGVSLAATQDPLEGVTLTATKDPLEGVTLIPTEGPLDNVSLVPAEGDEAPPFPQPSGNLNRREIRCV